MIKLQDSTPRVYYNHSRDFQFIGRLYDVVLNSVKTNSCLLYGLPLSDNSDEQLIDLMAMTLGFKSRHKYNVRQLTALCNGFSEIIKNKGNIQSINLAINALLRSEGISEGADVVVNTDDCLITLYIPNTLKDTNLLKDLMTYIIPAGMSCSIISEAKIARKPTTPLEFGTVSVRRESTNNYINSVIPTAEDYANHMTTRGNLGSSVLGAGLLPTAQTVNASDKTGKSTEEDTNDGAVATENAVPSDTQTNIDVATGGAENE